MAYEYKVVPAPARGLKAKGKKTAEERFAHALEEAMNDLARDGWEYIRSDTLPCEQREGLLSRTTVYQNVLVFRRGSEEAPQARIMPARVEPQRREPMLLSPGAETDDPETREA